MQASKGSNVCIQNAKYAKGYKSGKSKYVHKTPRRKLNGLPDMRFKANR